MSAKYVLITRFPLKNNIDSEQFKTLQNNPDKKYFLSDEPGINELLELRAFDNIAAIAPMKQNWKPPSRPLLKILPVMYGASW